MTKEWTEVIKRDISHPCIVAWVPFNESWGVPDLPDSPAQRHYVQALYHLVLLSRKNGDKAKLDGLVQRLVQARAQASSRADAVRVQRLSTAPVDANAPHP